jgi:hypothetical protein
LKRGWSLEKALGTEPNASRARSVAAQARAAGLTPATLRHRLKQGRSLEEAVRAPVKKLLPPGTPQVRTVRIKRSKAVPCADCGRDWPLSSMQHDHRPGMKRYEIATLGGRACTLPDLEAELAVCTPVCANCHLQREDERRYLKKHGLRLVPFAGQSAPLDD